MSVIVGDCPVSVDAVMAVVREDLRGGYFSEHMWEIIEEAVRIAFTATAEMCEEQR